MDVNSNACSLWIIFLCIYVHYMCMILQQYSIQVTAVCTIVLIDIIIFLLKKRNIKFIFAIQSVRPSPTYFARKFEHIISSSIISVAEKMSVPALDNGQGWLSLFQFRSVHSIEFSYDVRVCPYVLQLLNAVTDHNDARLYNNLCIIYSLPTTISDIPGLQSYWQNEFHHLDAVNRTNDAYFTYYRSFARHTVAHLARTTASCSFTVDRILESHVYSFADKIQVCELRYSDTCTCTCNFAYIQVYTRVIFFVSSSSLKAVR